MWRFLPGSRFPSVAIDRRCSLMCEHCGGAWLRSMQVAATPEALQRLGLELADHGGVGMLVSGGFDAKGRLPIGRFLPAIRQLTDATDLIVAVHTGIVDEGTAGEIASSGVHVVALDLIGSADTLREIYHLRRDPVDLLASAVLLRDAGIDVAPHITIGLHRGRIVGEGRALDMALELEAPALILNALIGGPLPGLDVPPFDLMREVRDRYPGRLLLGCMYPRGRGFPETAERLGFDGMVAPGPGAMEGCCALAVRDEWIDRLRPGAAPARPGHGRADRIYK